MSRLGLSSESFKFSTVCCVQPGTSEVTSLNLSFLVDLTFAITMTA